MKDNYEECMLSEKGCQILSYIPTLIEQEIEHILPRTPDQIKRDIEWSKRIGIINSGRGLNIPITLATGLF